MTAVSAVPAHVPQLPFGRPLTRADLELLPDDGHRYELLDGSLIVTPGPDWDHQRGVVELIFLLRSHCPLSLEVLVAPLDVVLGDQSSLQPDALVVQTADYNPRGLFSAPLLAVEVLSPSTRRVDLTTKRRRYERMGCQAYWVLDPREPSLTVWELGPSGYGQTGPVTGDDSLRVEHPFPLTLVPRQLVRRPGS